MKKGLLLLAVFCLVITFSQPVPAQQQVTVPNVVGMAANLAIDKIQALGLRAPITAEPTHDLKQAGKITKQSPAPGTKVAAGSAVALTVVMYQQAPAKVTVAPNVMQAFNPVMPNLVGKKFMDLRDPLQKVGIVYEKCAQFYMPTDDKRCDGGCITRQVPAAGAPVPQGVRCELFGNFYQERPKVTVPDVRLQPIEQAKMAIRNAGLTYGASSRQTARQDLHNKVFEQSPAPGTAVYKGESVSLTYGFWRESNLEVQAKFMPEARTYLLMIRGGVQPYDVRASYDIEKSKAGQKTVEIIGLKDNPDAPEWKLYRIVNKVPVEAVMVVTDAKGRRHDYKLHLTQANQ
jgi:beta-lactam-binding protein with PASTA domain